MKTKIETTIDLTKPHPAEEAYEGLPEHRNGPAMAAVVAAGFGAFVLGLFTTLAEASAKLKDWLAWNKPVGPLTGKTSLAIAAWVGAWIAFGSLWRNKEVSFRRAVIVTAVLLGLGVLMTFPTFFEQFATE